MNSIIFEPFRRSNLTISGAEIRCTGSVQGPHCVLPVTERLTHS